MSAVHVSPLLPLPFLRSAGDCRAVAGTSPVRLVACRMGEIKERAAIILVRARNPLNIGAVARAMTDFGFTDLRIVSPYPIPFENAVSAVDAAPLLRTARRFQTLPEAIAGCTLVYGTTALGARRLEHPVDLLPEAARRIAAEGRRGADVHESTSALLFGSEKTGLSNEEISYCHRLLTIPMDRTGVSMNLGQAVAVCLYELAGRGAAAPRALPVPEPAVTAENLLRMEDLLRQVLESSGYAQRFPGNMGEENLRKLLRRASLREGDFPIWMGMLRQVLFALQDKP